jgi:RNA polymerase sigma-70 factor (ECF subfamily)
VQPTVVDLPDAALVAAVGRGDRDALEALYRRHVPFLYLRLSRRCADPTLVEEAVQDTFVAVWREACRFRSDGDVGAWIWGIGIRRLIDQLRRQKRKPVGRREYREDDSILISAEEQVLTGVEYGDLAGALNRLSPELRLVVQAIVLDGLTSKEAAQLLGIPAGTVRTRLARAKAQMREALA